MRYIEIVNSIARGPNAQKLTAKSCTRKPYSI